MKEMIVAAVSMPERGSYLVRCLDDFPWREIARGRQAVITLDYGQDVGEVTSAGPYNPSVHGERLPGFRLERFVLDEDEARLAENAKLADEMREEFIREAGLDEQEARRCSARLSFGGGRLFLRVASDRHRQDFADAAEKMRQVHGVTVNVWQTGPRDEVACSGALGTCGRVCCCASWMKRFPAHISVPPGVNPSGANGICGRYKCCWAFER